MPTPSLISSDGGSSSSTCCCGQQHHSLHYAPARASSCNDQSTATDSQPKKVRYGGRGGAGSRARAIRVPQSTPSPTPSSPIVEDGQYTFTSIPESQTSDLTATWVKRNASPSASCDGPTETAPTPAISTSSLAGRRGANKALAPLILSAPAASPTVPTSNLNTPLSGMSTATTSTATDSDFAPTPRSPYFYFDDAFDSPSPSVSIAAEPERPLLSPTSSNSTSLSRSLRRLASRTQGLRDLFLKPPPPMPPTPTFPSSSTHPASPSPSHPVPPLPSPTPPRPSSQASDVSSQWYDHDPPASPSPTSSSRQPTSPPPSPIVLELPHPRARSASVATLKGPAPHAHARARKHKGDHRERERKPHRPQEQEGEKAVGGWNRDNLAEVIVSLRML